MCYVSETVLYDNNVYIYTDCDDLFDVKSELIPVATRWKHIGLALRLDPAQLSIIESDQGRVDDRLTEVLHLWLKKAYNSKRFGEPSWTLLARAVGHPAGGNNRALAEKIAEKYGGIDLLSVWVWVCVCVGGWVWVRVLLWSECILIISTVGVHKSQQT